MPKPTRIVVSCDLKDSNYFLCTVVTMSNRLNERLSVVTPAASLAAAAGGDAAITSNNVSMSNSAAGASRHVTIDGGGGGKSTRQTRRSTTQRRTGPVYSVRTRLALETASFTLYSGTTNLVRLALYCN